MDFARKQLEKYGWTEGKGLGKNEDGIESAIKPKLKFDTSGVGHDVGEQFTNNWWEKLFNSAADNIDIEVNDEGPQIKLKSDEAVEITTKSYSVKHLTKNSKLQYGSFLKTAKLTENGMENYDCVIKPSISTNTYTALTDEELFNACGGRTAHKGARHGLKLNGKLSRIEKQEKMLLKKMKKVSISDKNDNEKFLSEKKLKKLKKQKETNSEKYTPILEDSMESVSSNGLKKKKKRKSVSFNETVTKIYTLDLDSSYECGATSARDENVNEQNLEVIASGSDEGIELDIENNNDLVDNHRSFEVAQIKFDDISKAERKKMRKKRKFDNKKNNQTGIFLQKLNDDLVPETSNEDNVNKKKRKLLDEYEQDEKIYSITESPERCKNKKNKKKIKKQKKLEEKQMNSIAKSLDTVCRISESE